MFVLCIVCSLTFFYDSNSPVLKLMNWKGKWVLLNTKWLIIFCCIFECLFLFLTEEAYSLLLATLQYLILFETCLHIMDESMMQNAVCNISIRVRRPIYYCKVIVCTTKFIPQGWKKTFYIQSQTKDAGTSHFRLKHFL